MIDVESAIFNVVATALRVRFDGIFVSGENTDLPAKFPAVTIVEADNAVYERMRTITKENAVSVMYEVNVYTNTVGYKKSEAKEIMEVADAEFARLGFVRTMLSPISNLQEATIYRLVARYKAVIDSDFWIYQN